MRTFGILFIFVGVFLAFVGFASLGSDIQFGIAISGVNMIGIGVIMKHLGEKSNSPVK